MRASTPMTPVGEVRAQKLSPEPPAKRRLAATARGLPRVLTALLRLCRPALRALAIRSAESGPEVHAAGLGQLEQALQVNRGGRPQAL
jgi:hypothetical protein